MSRRRRLHLFEGFGVELEYMIVDRESFSVRPIADRILKNPAGDIVSEIEVGLLRWSNELVLHVLELKTNGPAPSLSGLGKVFSEHIGRVNALLEPFGAVLMPGAMHPWMDPAREMRLWPHENSTIYDAYNRIFGCRGHGWANLQSAHLNLPFAGDSEFARLHAAVRLLLPILPALAASSPVMEGAITGFLDTRLEVYRLNQRRVPSVAGRIIPEPASGRTEYRRNILNPMYEEIASLDPEGVLRHEWLNSRGAIARFERSAIEIRILDVQEHPAADLAIQALIVKVLEALVGDAWIPLDLLHSLPVESLSPIFLQTVRDGEASMIEDSLYLSALGFSGGRCTAGELWSDLSTRLFPKGSMEDVEFGPALQVILEQGTLARRILKALGTEPGSGRLRKICRSLCRCLAEGASFQPHTL